MVGEKKNESNRTVGHENLAQNQDLLCELYQASCVLESVILLLKHYKNDLGDDTEESWYGLSLILSGVLETVVEARDAVERIERGVKPRR